MQLPNQAHPILKSQDLLLIKRNLMLSDCGIVDGIKCTAEFAGLVIGPCDPLGFPEDLPLCIPAFAGFLSSCKDCVTGAAKTTICAAVSAASSIGIPIPGALQSFCS